MEFPFNLLLRSLSMFSMSDNLFKTETVGNQFCTNTHANEIRAVVFTACARLSEYCIINYFRGHLFPRFQQIGSFKGF